MERQQRPAPAPGTFTVEATAAFRAVAGRDEGMLLASHPSYQTNPYQSLLYGHAWEEGIAPVRMPRAFQIEELADLQAAGLPTVLHLHWLHPVQRDATSDRDARAMGAAFVRDVDAYLKLGGKLVWTVHNILPHETRYEAAEIALSEAVIARASVIHVLTAGTPELVAPYYALPPERLLHVPHPSYRGAYPDHVSRAEARHELGLSEDDFVAVALGAIRPYKGLDELLDAWQAVPRDTPRRLVIAGTPADAPGVDSVVERAAVDPRVLVDARAIPAEEIQLFMRAADVAVLPYRRALNSGALMLALTFGLPVIVPEGGGLAEVTDPAFARTFTPGDRPSLIDVLTAGPELATAAARKAAAKAAAKLDPAELSRQFARELQLRIGPGR